MKPFAKLYIYQEAGFEQSTEALKIRLKQTTVPLSVFEVRKYDLSLSGSINFIASFRIEIP
jgi:hypothetical protein